MKTPWWAYARERMRPGMLLAVSAMLTWAAGGASARWVTPLLDFMLAGLMVAGLRLWDDLEDLPHDRRAHPHRVLVRAPQALPFAVLAASLFAVAWALVLLSRGTGVALQFGALGGLLLGWYRLARKRVHGLAAYHVLLLKYPALVLLLAQRPGAFAWQRPALGACVVYGLACLYEGWHDPRYAQHRWLALVLGVEACFTAATLGHYLKSIDALGAFL